MVDDIAAGSATPTGDEPIRSMDEYRRRYFPASQAPHDWERSDRCERCDRPFDDPLHHQGEWERRAETEAAAESATPTEDDDVS
jgi:hypothetical protein